MRIKNIVDDIANTPFYLDQVLIVAGAVLCLVFAVGLIPGFFFEAGLDVSKYEFDYDKSYAMSVIIAGFVLGWLALKYRWYVKQHQPWATTKKYGVCLVAMGGAMAGLLHPFPGILVIAGSMFALCRKK